MVLGLVTDSDCVELVCVALATGCSARNSVEPTWFYTSFFLLCTNTSSLELRERLVIASWVFCQELNNRIQILLMKLLTYFRQRNNNKHSLTRSECETLSGLGMSKSVSHYGIAGWDALQTLFYVRSQMGKLQHSGQESP